MTFTHVRNGLLSLAFVLLCASPQVVTSQTSPAFTFINPVQGQGVAYSRSQSVSLKADGFTPNVNTSVLYVDGSFAANLSTDASNYFSGTFNTNNLNAGAHTLTASVTDYQNRTYSAAIVINVGTASTPPADTTSPTSGTLSAIAPSSSQVNLSWTSSTDNIGISYYALIRNGVQITTLGATSISYVDTAVTPSTTYTYVLKSVDAAGNYSQSNSVTGTTPAAQAPLPTIPSLTATPAAITQGQSTTLSWSTTGATTLSIDQSIGSVTGTSRTVSPTQTTTYTLTATNSGGSVTKTVTVTVNAVVIPPSTAFVVGDRIQTTATVNVRASGGTSGTLLGTQTTGSLGTIVGGGTSVDGFYWWNVNFDNGVDGYTAETYLTKYTAPVVTPPTVSTFTASPSAITTGQSTTLSWSTTGATSLSIDQGVGAVTGTSKTVSPTATTTYTLTATNSGGSTTKTVTVTVSPVVVPVPPTAGAPTVNYFIASNNKTTPGASNNALFWSVSGATNISVDQGIGQGNNFGDYYVGYVAPTQTTTYTLTATNGSGTITKQVTIYVVPTLNPSELPEILNFDIAKNPLPLNDPSISLYWNVTNGQSFAIDFGSGSYTSVGSNRFTTYYNPSTTTVITLKATNANGSVTKKLTVVETPSTVPPEFNLVSAPSTISPGEMVRIQGNVKYSDQIVVDNGVGKIANGDFFSFDVIPTQTTTYKISASNAAGTTNYLVKITVDPGLSPTISSFTATPNPITVGESALLSWDIKNEKTFRLLSYNNTVLTTSGRSLTVAPPATSGTYTYTLEVSRGTINGVSTSSKINLVSNPIVAVQPHIIAKAVSPTQINLTWDSVPGAAAYQIWKYNGFGFATQVATTTVPSYQDKSPLIDKQNQYAILAYTGTGAFIAQSDQARVYAPKTSVPNQVPVGGLESFTTDRFLHGWLQDPDNTSMSINGELYIDVNKGQSGANPISVTAPATEGDAGKHTFVYNIGTSLPAGSVHKAWLYGNDLNDTSGANDSLISGSPLTFTVPQTTPVSPTLNPLDDELKDFLNRINNYRVGLNKSRLDVNTALQAAAQWHVSDMLNNSYVSYGDSLGRSVGARLSAFGYTTTFGSDVQSGYTSASDIYNYYMSYSIVSQTGTRVYPYQSFFSATSTSVMGISRAFDTKSSKWVWEVIIGNEKGQVLPNQIPLPNVTYFRAVPATVLPGAKTSLSWNVQFMDSASIDKGIGAVAFNSVDVSPLVTTTYTLTAKNTTGSVSTSTTVYVDSSDYTPPSAPTNVTATATSSSQVFLTWSPSTDNVGVTSYLVSDAVTNSNIAYVLAPAVSYYDLKLAPNSSHSYVIRALDAAGNSNKSAVVQVTTPKAPDLVCGAPLTNAYMGCFYDNLTFSGIPTGVKTYLPDLTLDYSNGLPPAGVSKTAFSAKWSGNFTFAQGLYDFSTLQSDGMRVYVDSNKVFDKWQDLPLTMTTTGVNMTAGTHLITVEFYSKSGYPMAYLWWTKR